MKFSMLGPFFTFQFYRWILAPAAVYILRSTYWLLPKKMRLTVQDREKHHWPALQARPIWIHASSGEIEYARAVIREIRLRWPSIPILVTYFSPSAKNLLKKIPEVNLTIPLPWDLRRPTQKFLQAYRPLCGLFARSDVWPELAFQARKQNIPLLLFAATLSAKSRRKKGLAKSLNLWAFQHLEKIHCVTTEDELELKDMGVTRPVEVRGDTRFDQSIFRVDHPQPIHLKFKRDQRKVLVIGSSWAEDDRVLKQSLQSWFQLGHRAIWVPHEVSPVKIKHLQQELEQQKWSVDVFSHSQAWESQILLVDQVGFLAEFYLWGDIAFVGGSFRGKVHSVMEPLSAGLPVIIGPFFHNNREAMLFQRVLIDQSLSCVTEVRDAQEFQKTLQLVLETLQDMSPREWIQKKVQERAGASKAAADWIHDWVEQKE